MVQFFAMLVKLQHRVSSVREAPVSDEAVPPALAQPFC